MTVAAVDGDPPFPPEHTPCVTFAPSHTCDKNESDLFDDCFILDDEHPGTGGYGATAVVDFNRCTKNHHDPPQPQFHHSTTYISLAPPPPRYDLKQLHDDIRRMCESFVFPDPSHPPHNHNAITTTTTPTTAGFCQVVPSTCSDPPARCILPTTETSPSTDKAPTPPTTTTIPIRADNDAMTTSTTTTTPKLTATIDDDDADATTTTTPTHDTTTHSHLPRTTYVSSIRTPWLRTSFSLVFHAADRLDDAIADMSNAIADMSASIESMLSKPTPSGSPMLQQRFSPSPTKTKQPTSQPFPPGPIPSHRSRLLLPLPTTHPPFNRQNTLASMRPHPHPSLSFRATLLRMAKHNYRPP